jgi:hypothetical protein
MYEGEDEKFSRSKKDHSPTVQQRWSCCDQYPSGRLLVVEPDYLPNSKVFVFSHVYCKCVEPTHNKFSWEYTVAEKIEEKRSMRERMEEFSLTKMNE